jgi:hypothetical protein
MNCENEFAELLRLSGLEFARALMDWEKGRFAPMRFLMGSTFESINMQFGLFPSDPAYPCYFAGDIRKPVGKIVVIGINPGYSGKQSEEQRFLETRGIFEGYCELFSEFFAKNHSGLTPYFSNVAGFIKRLYDIPKIDWRWFQENVIHMDLVPYHSVSTGGLQINNPEQYRRTTFAAVVKLLEHINPSGPVFVNGYPTFAKAFEQLEFGDVINVQRQGELWVGEIAERYRFVGLPFLTRVKGGKDRLVKNLKDALAARSWEMPSKVDNLGPPRTISAS